MKSATAAYRSGNYAEAVARFQDAVNEAESLDVGDTRLAHSLFELALALSRQGRHAEAEPLYRRSLTINEKALGPDHPDVGGILNQMAGLYQDLGRYAEAEPLYRRSLSIAEKTLGPDHPSVGSALSNQAGLYRLQGRYAEAEPMLRRALAIREKALGPDHPGLGTTLHNLAGLYHVQGRYAEAEPLFRRSLTIRENALGPDHPDVGSSLDSLAGLYHDQGRHAEAEPLYRRGLRIREKVLGSDHPDVGDSLNNLASFYQARGRYAEAELFFRRSLMISEKAFGPEHPHVSSSLNNLALLYQDQGRYSEAEPLYRRSLNIAEKALGPDHPAVGTPLNNLGVLYQYQGRYAEAEPLLRRDLSIAERALGPHHPRVGATSNNLARLYHAQKRYAEAEPLYRQALSILETALAPDHPDLGAPLDNLAGLYRTQSRYAEAEPLLLRNLTNLEKTLGPDHPHVAMTLASLATLYRQQKRWSEGLPLVRRSTQSLAARFAAQEESGRAALLAEQRTRSWNFEIHVSLLYGAHGGEASGAAESFMVAQLARASDTAEQVARMAARHAGGNDALAQLARQRQDLVSGVRKIDNRIVQAASRAPKDRDAATEARLRSDGEATRKALAALDERMAREFPQYGELINPRPVALTEVQRLLGSDEALVAFLVSHEESFLWVLRRDRMLFERLAITRRELAALVRRLRAQLDLAVDEPAKLRARPFNVALAHELYTRLFAPGETLFAGAKHLIVVPDGALTSIPPSVLVDEEPIANPAWLARKYAITVLPSVGSLRALRAFSKGRSASDPFLGFGDPMLDGGSETRRAMVAALYSRGAVADTREVRKLARLPETADELKAIAGVLKAPANRVLLGAAATERTVKETDLSRYRTLAFATHGLMAGDFKGLAEPALVLTPPEAGSELDDGLLTAGEISQLKLNADWVILSACNTAAPDGTPGAEGLSGLARAFFYAGARSLLVSHWAVSSEATVALTTRMFVEVANGAPKSEALRRSMLTLMEAQGNPHFAHPAFWAPFVVVGEGGPDGPR